MSGSFADDGSLIISDGRIIVAVGKKRSGKSIMGKLFFMTYPGDRIVIDVAGDDGPMGDDVFTITGDITTLPRRWPESRRKYGPNNEWRPMTVRYVPDAGSETFLEDMDHMIGLGLQHGNSEFARGRIGCCILVHEIGVVAPMHKTQNHMKRLLAHNRHNHATAIFCGPRPQTVDPLVLQQADLIFIFEMMNPYDRKRVAETIGWSPREFDEAVHDLELHEYLRFDANEDKPGPGEDEIRLLHFPPLPEEVVRKVG
jgi:hypothetical protein